MEYDDAMSRFGVDNKLSDSHTAQCGLRGRVEADMVKRVLGACGTAIRCADKVVAVARIAVPIVQGTLIGTPHSPL